MSNHNKKTGAPPRLDATNLAGMTALMNPQNVKRDVDLELAEKTVMGRGDPPERTAATDPVVLYSKALNELANELGINLGDDAVEDDDVLLAESASLPPPSPRPNDKPHNPLGDRSIGALIGDLDLESASEEEEEGEETEETEEEEEEAEEETETEAEEEEEETDRTTRLRRGQKNLNIDLEATRARGQRRLRVHDVAVPAGYSRPRLTNLTEEQERRQHINAVMGGMRQETRTFFGVESERIQDVKASKLEQIGQLRTALEEEGIDCAGVGTPTMASPVDEIDSVLAILKLKNDRNRYSSLAEEVILGAAEGVEAVFDGTREIPVIGWKPDYTGYHNTVNVKLHRMRFETSQIVGNIMEKFNVGPLTRIAMELLPSFFLYPRQQRKQRGTPGLHADFAPTTAARGYDARGAYSTIRRADIPDYVLAVSNI